jgi:hypothetical protein
MCTELNQLEHKFHFRVASTSPIEGSVTLAVKREHKHHSERHIVTLIATVTETEPISKVNVAELANMTEPFINYIADIFPNLCIYIVSPVSIMQINRSRDLNHNILLYEHTPNEWRICAKQSNHIHSVCMNIVYNDTDLNNIIHKIEYKNESPPLELLEFFQHRSGLKTKIKRSWKNFRKALGFHTTKKVARNNRTFKLEIISCTWFDINAVQLLLPEVHTPPLPVPREFYGALDDKSYQSINVKGDGWCGYYVLKLIKYMLFGQINKKEDIRKQLNYIVRINKKRVVKPHWLEIQEFALIGQADKFNVAALIKRDEQYVIEVYCYDPMFKGWFFPILRDNVHYQLLCARDNKQLCIQFDKSRAMKVFEAFGYEYPRYAIDPQHYLKHYDAIQDRLFI